MWLILFSFLSSRSFVVHTCLLKNGEKLTFYIQCCCLIWFLFYIGSCFISFIFVPERSKMAIFIAAHMLKHYLGYEMLFNDNIFRSSFIVGANNPRKQTGLQLVTSHVRSQGLLYREL